MLKSKAVMPTLLPVPRSFFARPTLTVAQQLLGQSLVKRDQAGNLVGLITEVEAYIGENDLACHARVGRTKRTSVMYGPPGHLYVYFNYGMHWMVNIVTEDEGFPAAILLRGLQATAGLNLIRRRRQRDDHLTDGPAKLAQAFAIDQNWNGYDLCQPKPTLFIAQNEPIARNRIRTAPRVGLGATPEPWLSRQWNFSYSTKT